MRTSLTLALAWIVSSAMAQTPAPLAGPNLVDIVSATNQAWKMQLHCQGACNVLSPPAVADSIQFITTGQFAGSVTYWYVTNDGQCFSAVMHKTDPNNPHTFATPVTGIVSSDPINGQYLQFFTRVGVANSGATDQPLFPC